MSNLSLPLFIMLIACFAEQLIRRVLYKETAPWREVIFNLNSGHAILWIFRGLEVAAFAWIVQHASLDWISHWPSWLQFLFGFIAWDFCFYWMHRLHHKIPLLWAVHGMHHEGEHFDLSLGIRNSWYSSLSNFPFVVGLAFLGLPAEIFVVVSSIHYTVQLYNHNSLVRGSGVLEYLMVTPAYHRVHHGKNAVYLNKNFCGTLQIWDHLFATFQPTLADEPIQLGVKNPLATRNPLLANHIPFLKQLSKNLPKRIGAIVPENWLARAGFVLFLVMIFYVHVEQSWPQTPHGYWRWGLISMLTFGTILIGAISDGKKWGLWMWSILLLGLIYFFVRVAWPIWAANLFIANAMLIITIGLIVQMIETIYVGFRSPIKY
jgi:sterol desaturase/sphingolipid hydroxylase (fatty acid hydroxylase superfamily)